MCKLFLHVREIARKFTPIKASPNKNIKTEYELKSILLRKLQLKCVVISHMIRFPLFEIIFWLRKKNKLFGINEMKKEEKIFNENKSTTKKTTQTQDEWIVIE